MLKRSPQPDPDLSSSEGPFDSVASDPTPHPPSTATPLRRAELERLLGATIDENRSLTTRVLDLEAELRRRSVDLAGLRGELLGAVRDALTDPLTGLANRRSFDRELTVASTSATEWSPAHLVMVDVDHFKRINDAHGHDIGDEVLRIVGEILLANIRRDGLIARLGGDEFGLLLPRASQLHAAGIAVRLCELLASRPLAVRGHPEVIERVTLSIGVAGCRGGQTGAQWYARADAALYEAKRTGRNRTCVAHTSGPEFRVRRPM